MQPDIVCCLASNGPSPWKRQDSTSNLSRLDRHEVRENGRLTGYNRPMTYWFTHLEHGGFPIERAALGSCDLSIL
jgi:hypothetical protein